jgi:hypothetical protein
VDKHGCNQLSEWSVTAEYAEPRNQG